MKLKIPEKSNKVYARSNEENYKILMDEIKEKLNK